MLGYHGCDKAAAETLLSGTPFKRSQNDYDWLGPGIYFWEANPIRGLEFAAEARDKRRNLNIKDPFVIGAVIDLGLCLDLTTSAGVQQVARAHQELTKIVETAGAEMPKNSGDALRRNLDCAVIRTFHFIRENSGDPAVDSVRGVFQEGAPIYEGSGFHQKTHIQISVRNPECIKGVFRVPESQLR